MIFGLGWKAFWISLLALIALNFLLRAAGCNVLIL